MVPSKVRGWVPIHCRPSIVTLPLSLRVSEILPLLCSSTPLFPTPPLVFPKFPRVPPRIGGWPLGYEERSIGLVSLQLVSKISKLCDHNPPTSQTDGQTDRQTDSRTDDMQSQYRGLRYSASRVKNHGYIWNQIWSILKLHKLHNQ